MGGDFMTRAEQKINAAEQYAHVGDMYDLKTSFIAGAEWADKTMLDKVCKWLDVIDFDMTYWNSEEGFCKEDFINDFKKAMEE